MRFKTALLLASAFSVLATPALAIPVLFGGASAPDANGAALTDVAPGQTVTVTGPVLQLRLADGSTVIAPQGASFTVSSEAPVSIALVSGSLRVNSAGTPVTVTRGGTAITTTGGVFSAAAQGAGLAGRVNQGTVQVAAGGQVRSFNAGGGYVASGSGVSSTFTPPVASAPSLSGQSAQPTNPPGYSAADPRTSSGAGQTVVAAAQSSGFPVSGSGSNTGNAGNTGTDNTGTGNTDTGNTGTGNTGTDNTGTGNTGTGGTITYGGTPAVTGTVELTGTNKGDQVITYAGDVIGIDVRNQTSVTIGANGELNGYRASHNEHPERNTNQSLDRATVGGISIERWSGGVTGGDYFGHSGTARTSNQGLHLAYGAPAPALPAQGLATYTLAASTKPTLGFGGTEPGTMTAGRLGILFSVKPKLGVDFSVTMPGDGTYNVKTAGGAAAPSYLLGAENFSKGYFYSSGLPTTGNGQACAGSCTSMVYGILGGTKGDTVGVSYEIGPITSSDANGRRNTVTGAAIFSQDSFDPSQGAVAAHPAVSSGALDAPLRGAASAQMASNFYVVPKQGLTTSLSASKPTVDAQGRVDSFVFNNTLYTRGDNSIAELYGSKYVQVGRWNGGTTKKAGDNYLTSDGWQGMPYFAGIPVSYTQWPTTGVATYELKGAAAPMLTNGDTEPGSFSGKLGIDFTTATPRNSSSSVKVGVDGLVTVNTAGSAAITYNIGTTGGAATPSTSQLSVSSNGSIFGFYSVAAPTSGDPVCGGPTCSVQLTGLIAGPGGRDAAIGYNVGVGAQTQIVGTAAFARTDDPSLAHKDVGIRGLLMAPGTAVLTNSWGVQNLVNNVLVTYTSDDKGVQAIKDARNFEAVTAQVVDRGTAGGLTWSRWSDGTVSDAFGVVPALGANQGMHQIVGEPGTNIPTTGTAQYTLAGYTKPTSTDNSVAPGTFAGSMAVQFGSASASTGVGLDFQVGIGGHTYNVATTGGVADPGQSQLKLFDSTFGSAYGHGATINVTPGGVACPNASCRADVSGFLAGFGGGSAGVGYTISEFGTPNNPGAVQGTAAFTKAP